MRVRFFLDELRTDPTQFKPYSPLLKPVGAVVVEFTVPDEMARLEENGEVIILSEQGFEALLIKVANRIQSAHDRRTGEDPSLAVGRQRRIREE